MIALGVISPLGSLVSFVALLAICFLFYRAIISIIREIKKR